MLSLVAASRPEWRREVALRLALALLPCAVVVLSLRAVLGAFPIAWLVPMAMTFGNALMVVSLARETLGRRSFLIFWALYGLAWTAVAWHGLHFHRAPRPAALFMNLEELFQVPMPGWDEVPWAVLIAVLGLGVLARHPSPRGRDLRFATVAAVALCAVLQAYAFLRYQTRDMLRFSEYRDLVRTHGLEGAVTLDGLEILHSANSGPVLGELRRDASENPARPLPLGPVRVDRMVVVQIESLDREALTADVAPELTGIWSTATRGLVTVDRTSVSGSSSADFQLLTGLRARAGVPVYRLGWDGAGRTLPDHAAARGFRFHAYHGNDRNFWNRGPFFTAIHASFHSAESMPGSEFSRWGRADGDLFRFAAARNPGGAAGSALPHHPLHPRSLRPGHSPGAAGARPGEGALPRLRALRRWRAGEVPRGAAERRHHPGRDVRGPPLGRLRDRRRGRRASGAAHAGNARSGRLARPALG